MWSKKKKSIQSIPARLMSDLAPKSWTDGCDVCSLNAIFNVAEDDAQPGPAQIRS